MTVQTARPEVIGSYQIVAKIAEGGMGTVYRARHRETGVIVAIKVLAPHLTKNAVLLQRFAHEYQAARAISHPNIVQAIEFGRADGTPYLVLEFVNGESLGQRLERERRLGADLALQIIGQVAAGLGHAHKLGMIHRDIKPDNILLAPSQPGFPEGLAKLTDLGLMKDQDTDQNLTRTGRGLGTPHFMAPEQFRNAKNASVRCDIYSLGATLYMMVTGELPFRGNGPLDVLMKKINNELPPPRDLVADLPEPFDRTIRRAMSIRPEDRQASCEEFMRDLTTAVESGGPPLTATEETGPPGPDASGLASLKETRNDVPTNPKTRAGTPRPPAPAGKPIPATKEVAAFPATIVDLEEDAENDTRKRPMAPHIDLGVASAEPAWLKWVTLLVVATGSGILGYLLLH